MKKVNREILDEAAKKTMLKIEESEYDFLLSDFEIIIQQMDLISKIEGVDDASPMAFPYEISSSTLREDVPSIPASSSELLSNSKDIHNNQIRIPKVVEK